MKNLIDIILEKLKISSKTKINNDVIKDFSEYIENNTSFGISLSDIKNNKIQKGKFYNVSNTDNIVIYLFPLYITMDNEHCLGINLTCEVDGNKNCCILSYVIGNINKSNKLEINTSMSGERIQDFDEDINFDKYIKIIKKLYNLSKKMNPNDFLYKYEKIINENLS